MDINRPLHPTAAEHKFLSSHETFTKIDHILDYRIHRNKFKRREIIQCLFSDHSGIILEITNTWKIPNT